MTPPRKDNVRENREAATSELRDKVRSKMDVGKFFAGFISLLIGIVLKEGHLESMASRFGIVFLISSLSFCVAAIFCYDRLLMPREYWTALSREEKAEETFQDRLQEQMVRSWTWLFVPAVWCFGIGFILLLADGLGLRYKFPCTPVETLLLVIFLTVGVASPILLGKYKGPRIYD